MRANTAEEVLKRSTPEPNTGCLLWTGTLDRDGYPATVKVRQRHVRPHRLAWESVNGPVPVGMDIRHSCTIRSCILPAHLYLGQYGGRPSRSVEDRFAECITPEPNSGCLLWTGYADEDGYGQIKVGGRGGKPTRAHRLAWEMVNGPIPKGLEVLHHCDNPACVLADADPRKSHLFLGTNFDNIADRHEKGRSALCGQRGEEHYNHLRAPEERVRGDRHGRRKLSEAQVLVILERLTRGDTQTAIALDFGVSKSAVNLIATGQKWAHLARPAA